MSSHDCTISVQTISLASRQGGSRENSQPLSKGKKIPIVPQMIVFTNVFVSQFILHFLPVEPIICQESRSMFAINVHHYFTLGRVDTKKSQYLAPLFDLKN